MKGTVIARIYNSISHLAFSPASFFLPKYFILAVSIFYLPQLVTAYSSLFTAFLSSGKNNADLPTGPLLSSMRERILSLYVVGDFEKDLLGQSVRHSCEF